MKTGVVVVSGACICVAGFLGYWGDTWSLPRDEWQRLLDGDARVEVTSLVISVDDKQIVLNDADTTRYLTRVLRSASRENSRTGTSYYATVQFRSGRSVEVGLYVPDSGKDVTV
jgi:hypothetical protein